MLETVKNWLAEFAGDVPIWVDYLDSSVPGMGLYPMGVREMGRSTDILGNQQVKLRCRFTVRFTAVGLQDQSRAAAHLVAFAGWVAGSKHAPSLGMDTRWYTENGRLEKVTKTPAAVYCVDLIAEWKKREENNEN